MICISISCLAFSALVAFGNLVGCIAAVRRKRRGIDRGYSSVPLISLVFAFLAWLAARHTIGAWAFLPTIIDPGTWMLVVLPWVFVKDFGTSKTTGDWHRLTQFLMERLPADIPYDDLAQLCLGLHACTTGMPDDLLPLLNKDDQACAFAEFVRLRFDSEYGSGRAAFYGASLQPPTGKGHWIEVIASIYKIGNTLDLEREKAIRKKYISGGTTQV